MMFLKLMFYFVCLTVSKVGSEIINFADVECGISKLRQAKVVGGVNASPGEFPWLVSITRRGGHFCGGSLITKRHVLTAAHCVCDGADGYVNPASIKLTLGQHDLKKKSASAFVMGIRLITAHPEYQCNKVRHDIAILELDNDITFSDNVQPACVSWANTGSSAIVAGWGWTSENNTLGESRKPNILQKAQLIVLGNDICSSWFKSQGKKTRITERQLCAGYKEGGIDACWADSGGPLMVFDGRSNGLSLIGVVSTGIGCARPYLPGVYTRISEYISWIHLVLDSNR